MKIANGLINSTCLCLVAKLNSSIITMQLYLRRVIVLSMNRYFELPLAFRHNIYIFIRPGYLLILSHYIT